MRAGQDAMKQFDDTLVSVAGVGPKDHGTSSGQFFSFSFRERSLAADQNHRDVRSREDHGVRLARRRPLYA
jgi:hypothetical protein